MLVIWTCMECHAQDVQRWWRTYDHEQHPELLGSAAIMSDTTYRIAVSDYGLGYGLLLAYGIADDGDTLWSKETTSPLGLFLPGTSGAVRPDGSWLWAGSQLYSGGQEPDALLIAYTTDGDTLWARRYGDTLPNEGFNCVCMAGNGDAVCGGIYFDGASDVLVMRVDPNGDPIWSNVFHTPQTDNALSIRPTLDGGFVLGGFKVLPGNDYDMYVSKIDSTGDLQWQRSHGSPWIDNAGFVEALPQGGYIMAGAERQTDASEKRPALYRLDDQGFEDWSVIYDDEPDRSVFFTVPVIMGDGGYAIAGDRNYGAQTRGMLMRTDSSGNMLWRRIYQTNSVIDHYFYDLRRTLDGGFIMAGTAFDSLLVSQDAWLVKTDSFGCLVPGCQVFDGLEEQITDLTGAITLSPNPADEGVKVTISLPPGTVRGNQLTLAMVDAQGRLVHQEEVRASSPAHPLTLSPFPSGLYFMHLLDGRRWLAGAKLIKE